VHDDLFERDFTADAPNQLWLADITEHSTREAKLHICAVNGALSNRIVRPGQAVQLSGALGCAGVTGSMFHLFGHQGLPVQAEPV
jgi:transposase InsO family protein